MSRRFSEIKDWREESLTPEQERVALAMRIQNLREAAAESALEGHPEQARAQIRAATALLAELIRGGK